MSTSASYQVLHLPELLEEILYSYLTLDSDFGLKEFYHVRGVCKLWRSILDTSPVFLPISWRDPRIRQDTEGFRICTDFLLWLFKNMSMPAFERSDYFELGFENFEKFSQMVLGESGDRATGGAFPDVFLTQPTIDKAALSFSFYGETQWEDAIRTYRRQDLDDSYWVGHQQIMFRFGGIRTTHVVQSIAKVFRRMQQCIGTFRVLEIVLRFGIKEDTHDEDILDGISVYSLDDCEREYVLWRRI